MNPSYNILILSTIGCILSIVSLIVIHKIKNERIASVVSNTPIIIVVGTILILITGESDKQIDEALFIIPFSMINDLLFYAFWKYDTLYLHCLCCPKLNTISAILIGLPMSCAVWCIYSVLMFYSLRTISITTLFIRLVSLLMIVLTASTGFIGLIHEVWNYNVKAINNDSLNYHQQNSCDELNNWSNEKFVNEMCNNANNNENNQIFIEREDDDHVESVNAIMDDSDGKEVEDMDNFDDESQSRDNRHGHRRSASIPNNVVIGNNHRNQRYIQKPMDVKEISDHKIPLLVYFGRGIMTFFALNLVGMLSIYGDPILAGFCCVFPSLYSIMVVFLYSKFSKSTQFDTFYATVFTKSGNNIFVVLSGLLYLDLNLNAILSVIIAWIVTFCIITLPTSYLYLWRDSQIQKPELTILRKYISFNL